MNAGEALKGWTIRRLLAELKERGISGGLRAAARRLRGLRPVRSDPDLYQEWIVRQEPSRSALERMKTSWRSLPYHPLVSVVTPVHDTDARWLQACIESVEGQVYPHWQLCLADDGSTKGETLDVLRKYAGEPHVKVVTLGANAGISAALNAGLALAEGEYVAFLDHDDELAPDALFEIVSCLNADRDTDFLYSDEDKLDSSGSRCDVFFKPDWSPEHLLSAMYVCHLLVVRRDLIGRLGGFRTGYEGAQDYDLVLRLIEHTTRIQHIPKVLYHWRKIPRSTAASADAKRWAYDAGRKSLEDYVRRNELDAAVLPGDHAGVYRVRFAVTDEPLVSVILPPISDERAHAAEEVSERFVRGLLDRTRYPHIEALVPWGADQQREWTAPPFRDVPWRSIATVSAERAGMGAMNQAALQARGDYLLFLDWDLYAPDAEWLSALLEYAQQSPIGAVGGKLLRADDRLEHIGLLVGVNGVAAPALGGHPSSSLGYFSSAVGVRNYSAVSALGMMTRKKVFEQLGGFRSDLTCFADVDYCLRLRSSGFRVVFTPYALLVHSPVVTPDAQERLNDEQRFRALWKDGLPQDPYYNVNLSRRSADYQPDPAPSLPLPRVVIPQN